MIVRTYGRRKPGISRSYSDGLDDDVSDPLSQETASQDYYYSRPFSSEESSSRFSAFDFESYGHNSSQEHKNTFDTGAPRKTKKARKEKSLGRGVSALASTSTLMEAQEFGEMMEHVDEVNFALDGLRKGQPIRIRWASLLSLLGVCATAQQRRLLRTQGIAKTIIDAVLGLNFDDATSNLAAATLLYVLTCDGQDDHILESPSCIKFLIKLLKPVISAATEDKAPKIGCKLLALRKDADILRDKKTSGFGSEAILSKVEEILVSCKEIKSRSGDDSVMGRLELCPKWVALLTMEKACISAISLDDASGTVRKAGGNFKEKLRELGGLDAVFGVTLSCHSVMENWMDCGMPSFCGAKDDVQKLLLLLKCLKIMENATFLSKDNQSHLLGLKGDANLSSPILFTELILSIIKILSGLYLHKWSSVATNDKKFCNISDGNGCASGFALNVDTLADSNGIISISSKISSGINNTSVEETFNVSQRSKLPYNGQLENPISISDTAITASHDSCSVMMRANSSKSGSCSATSRSSNCGPYGNDTMKKFGFGKRFKDIEDSKFEILEENQDPFAFDEDDFEPSKWDTLCGKKKKNRTRKIKSKGREADDGCQLLPVTSHQESNNGEFHPKITINRDNHSSNETSFSNTVDEEKFSLLSDCLLTAVKVLMNLTNDNPEGCQQIAACGGLEALSSLIANHFPYYSSSSSLRCEIRGSISCLNPKQQDERHLSDQELDFLVAVLGLLVNLVEKDRCNRLRLARASVLLHSSAGSLGQKQQDVIPLLCSIFLSNRGVGEVAGEDVPWNDDEAAILEGEKEAEKMIVEAYSALLLAFLASESRSIRHAIADCLPEHSLEILVPVLERFVAFHLTLNMLPPETHKAVSEVIESCKAP